MQNSTAGLACLMGFLTLNCMPKPTLAQSPALSNADYELVANTKLGAPGFWDYLTFDSASQLLYVAHINKVEVLDVKTGKPIGSIGPFHDTHGIAIVPDLGKGYADSGDDGVVKVFNLSDFKISKEIKVSPDADGLVYDSGTKKALVVAGDSKNLTIVDVATDTVSNVVMLPGKPEFLALDGRGHVFINIADHASIAKVDISSASVVANWPMANCKAPHGLAYDPPSNRLFSGCANEVMAVVDAESGNQLATLPIGPRSDAIIVDSVRRRAMSANADGTMTVVSLGEHDAYAVQRTVLTYFGGRNATIDPESGTVFVAHGEMKLMSSTKDLLNLRFGWEGLDVTALKPNK